MSAFQPAAVQARMSLKFSTLLLFGIALTGGAADPKPKPLIDGVVQLARLPKGDDFKESSGLIRSRQHPGVFWTHNDGATHHLRAINRAGEKLATIHVPGILMWDWEDIADDADGNLYLADIGNNLRARTSAVVYRIKEPDPNSDTQAKVDRSWRLVFAGVPFDAEGLVIWGDHGYLVSKTEGNQRARLYRWPLAATDPQIKLVDLGELNVFSPVCGADISRDGGKLGLVTIDGACVFNLTDGPESAVGVEPFGKHYPPGQVEGCAFDEDGLVTVAESRQIYLYHDPAFIPETTTTADPAPSPHNTSP